MIKMRSSKDKTPLVDKVLDTDEKKESKIVTSRLNKDTLKVVKKDSFLKGALCVMTLFSLLMFVWNFIMLMRPKNEMTGIVTIDPLTGNQRYLSNAVQELTDFTNDESVMLNTLKTYITKLRSVSNDDGVNKENINYVYAYSTENASNFISSYYKEHNPITINNTEKHKVDVIIYNAMPISSKSGLKFQVDWNEITRTRNGTVVSEQNYRADIDCKQYKATKITSTINPIGFYVTNIGISEIKNGFIVNVNSDGNKIVE